MFFNRTFIRSTSCPFSILTNLRIFRFVFNRIFTRLISYSLFHFDELENLPFFFILVNILFFLYFDEESSILFFIFVNILLFFHFDQLENLSFCPLSSLIFSSFFILTNSRLISCSFPFRRRIFRFVIVSGNGWSRSIYLSPFQESFDQVN